MKGIEWWRGTAKNAFKTYFFLIRNGKHGDLTPVEQRKYAACDQVFRSYGAQEQEIIRTFYEADWGDDRYVVEDISARTGLRPTVIWLIVKKAGRDVIEGLGLMDRGANNNTAE